MTGAMNNLRLVRNEISGVHLNLNEFINQNEPLQEATLFFPHYCVFSFNGISFVFCFTVKSCILHAAFVWFLIVN